MTKTEIKKNTRIQQIPCQGDIILVDFKYQIGHEQRGRRPALVLSNNDMIRNSNMALVCPLSTRIRDKQPYRVILNEPDLETTGVVMCDQARVIDVRSRYYRYVESVTVDTLESVKLKLKLMME